MQKIVNINTTVNEIIENVNDIDFDLEQNELILASLIAILIEKNVITTDELNNKIRVIGLVNDNPEVLN
jgi:hypothetical protein